MGTRLPDLVRIATATSAALVLAACSAAPTGTTQYRSEVAYEPVSLDSAPALPGVIAANDALGLTMLRTGGEAAGWEGNTVVSPFSAYVALAMLAEGARGGTASAFDAALGASGEARTDAVAALRGALLEYDGDPALAALEELPEAPLLHLADRVVLDDQFAPEDAYLDALARRFDAGIETVDLGDPAAKQVLDEWVDRQTGGLVPESAIEPDPNLRLVLQDAMVLAARWLQPFDPGLTGESPFEAPGGTVDVNTMRGSSGWAWTVTETGDWTSVRMPYVEGFVADLVLPPVGIDPADADQATLTRLWTEGSAAPDGPLVVVSLPVLDLRARMLDLTPALAELGLGELFDGPDLSGITTAEDLHVTQAVQQALLKLHEEGTVAAAVTEIGVAGSAAPTEIVEVNFDRPFLVRVAHADTNLTLFLAAIRDPSLG
jgi:serine protease inhibitor